MKKLVPIPPESLNRLKKDDLKGFGYQFVSIKLKEVDADGEPWNFRRRAVRTRTPPRK